MRSFILLFLGAVALSGCGSMHPYASAGRQYDTGRFTVDVAAAGVSVPAANIAVSGASQSLCGGLRLDIVRSPLSVGGEFCSDHGTVGGEQVRSVTAHGETASLRLAVQSDREYNVRMTAGLAITPRWRVEATHGMGAALFDLQASVSGLGHAWSVSESGWGIGRHTGVRVVYRVAPHASVSLGYERISYHGVDVQHVRRYPITIAATQDTAQLALRARIEY